jgi:hypothetical protein
MQETVYRGGQMSIKVIQKEGEPEVPEEVIAQSIAKLADGWDRMNRSGLSWKAIVLLLSSSSGVCKRDVEYVLHAMNRLRTEYLLQPKKEGK